MIPLMLNIQNWQIHRDKKISEAGGKGKLEVQFPVSLQDDENVLELYNGGCTTL